MAGMVGPAAGAGQSPLQILAQVLTGLAGHVSPGITPNAAENMIPVGPAVNFGANYAAQNPAAVTNLPTTVLGLNNAVGGAFKNTMESINPLLGIMHGLRAIDQGVNGPPPEEPTPQGDALPPLTWEGMQQDQWSGNAPEKPDPNVLFSTPFDINSMPQPPVYGEPPKVDENMMQSAKRSSILGALAKGAASVDATEPGSFARALAASGGAGAAEAGNAQEKFAEVSYNNAVNAYNVAMKNAETKYEFEGKKFEMTLPQIKATNDGVIVQEFNNGKYQTRYIPTNGIMGDASKLKDFTEAISGSGPAAEATEVQYVANLYKNDPAALQTILTRMSIERTIDNGAGSAAFGEFYDDAAKGVNVPAGLMTKPAEYRKEMSKQITSKLLSNPEFMKTMKDWLPKAASYGSVSAGILTGGLHGE